MIRRISKLPVVLIVAILLLCLPMISALALESGDYTYEVSNGKATITGYVGGGGDIIIPSKLGGCLVTAIGDSAFDSCRSLTSVTIPDGVISIGRWAFVECRGLTSVIIPDSVTSIGSDAFAMCESLTSVTIPGSVTSIGKGAFTLCRGLSAFYVDTHNVNYYSQDGVLFTKEKKQLIQYPIGNARTNYAIPGGVTAIGDGAFQACALTEVIIPDGVTSIGTYSFGGCMALKSIILPSSVTSIDDLAFDVCKNLECAVFRGNAPALGMEVFDGKRGFTVYYVKGKTGFTNPWHEYPTATYILPVAPMGVKAVSVSSSSAKLTWSAVSGAGGYEVYRATSSTGTYTRVATLTGDSVMTHTDTGLATGTAYFYRVRAYGLVGTAKVYGGFSAIVSPFAPAAPTGVKVGCTSYSSVKLTWGAVAGASGYEIYRTTSSTGTYDKVATITGGSAVTYSNSDMITGTTYYYKLRAYRTVGATKVYGDYSAVASARPVPAVPLAVKATCVAYDSVNLTWDVVPGASGYEVYRATASTGAYVKVSTLASGSMTSYTNKTLTTGTTYYCKVRAYRTVGMTKVYSDYSAVASARPVPAVPLVSRRPELLPLVSSSHGV